MERFLLVCLAGALGTGTRYAVGSWATRTLGDGFPYGTLFVNLAGCFLIAVVMHVALNSATMSDTARITLTTGFMGGLTTYSAFNYETTRLFQSGEAALAVANLGITLVGCFAAGLLGLAAARALIGG